MVVGVLTDDHGRVVIAQRVDGPFRGLWEFPGGKIEPGETPGAALTRELYEELGVRIGDTSPLIRITHRYPDRVVTLDTYVVEHHDGVITGAEGQRIKWVAPADLFDEALLPADGPLTMAINLPHRYLITPDVPVDASAAQERQFLDTLMASLDDERTLVCLRCPTIDIGAYASLARLVCAQCASRGVSVMLHGYADTVPLARDIGAAGVHLRADVMTALERRPIDRDLWLACSASNAAELRHAQALDADFAILGPVANSPMRTGRGALGWQTFRELVADAALPVFAFGGMNPDDVHQARAAGAQGIAAIRGLYKGGN